MFNNVSGNGLAKAAREVRMALHEFKRTIVFLAIMGTFLMAWMSWNHHQIERKKLELEKYRIDVEARLVNQPQAP